MAMVTKEMNEEFLKHVLPYIGRYYSIDWVQKNILDKSEKEQEMSSLTTNNRGVTGSLYGGGIAGTYYGKDYYGKLTYDSFQNSIYGPKYEISSTPAPTIVQFDVCKILADGSIEGNPHDVKNAWGYECILNLAKKYAELEKTMILVKEEKAKWEKEYQELSVVAIAMDDVLTKKLDRAVQKKYDELVADKAHTKTRHEVEDDADILRRIQSVARPGAFHAIQTINRNGAHASLESVIDNGNLAKTS
jgi:hypothetical protein